MIKFRHFKYGDEQALADLFNVAYQQNGIGAVRTLKNLIWRFMQSPGFEPEMCQIAEYINTNKIIGAVYANLIEFMTLGDKKYLIGEINDVSCHPDYTGRGIASKLMEMSIDYMKYKGCDFSILSTGFNGIARKYIYKKLGYIDFEREGVFIQFPNIFQFMRNIYGLSLLFPAFFLLSYFPRLFNRIKIKHNIFLKKFSYDINYNHKHSEYLKAVNKIMPLNYEGFEPYDKYKFIWARIKVPSKRQRPTYILIKKNGIIIGGAVITHQNLYAFKYGIKIRIGLIHEIFLDERIFKNNRDLHHGYIYLIDKIMKAATQRSTALLIYFSSSRNNNLNLAFKMYNFIRIPDSVVMIKELKEDVKIPNIKKPLFIAAHLSFGVP